MRVTLSFFPPRVSTFAENQTTGPSAATFAPSTARVSFWPFVRRGPYGTRCLTFPSFADSHRKSAGVTTKQWVPSAASGA